MAAIANIVLNDSTAAARTFKPHIKDGLVVSWRADYAAKPALYPTLSVGMRPEKGDVTRKVTVKVTYPIEVTTSGVTTTKLNTAFVEVVVANEASVTDVDNLVTFTAGALSNAIVSDTVENGNFPY